MRQFAMGAIFAPSVMATGNLTGTNTVPIAVLKDCTIDFKVTKKALRGQWKSPIDVGEGPVDITGKIKQADFRANTTAMVLAGTTITTASTELLAPGETWAIPTTPFQVTVTNAATWQKDGGVYDITGGLWMARIGQGSGSATVPNPLPTTGQFYVNPATGIYTFAAADVAHNLQIFYSYSSTTQGSKIAFPNQVMGQSVGYPLAVYNLYNVWVAGVAKVRPVGFYFPNFHFDNYSIALKAEDFAEADLSGFAAQDLLSTNVFTEFVGE